MTDEGCGRMANRTDSNSWILVFPERMGKKGIFKTARQSFYANVPFGGYADAREVLN